MGKLVWGGSILLALVALARQPDEQWRPLPDDPEIEAITQSTLSQPEFQRQSSRGWWASLMESVRPWLLSQLSGARGLSSLLAYLLLAGLMVAVGLALFSLFSLSSGGLQTLAGLRGRSRAWRSLEGEAGSWEEALLKARQALAEGRLYNAVWIMHRVFLGLLDQREVVDFAKWKTNRDYLRECPREDPAFPLFATVSHAYDRVVYAHLPISADRLAELLDQIEATRWDEAR